MSFQGTALKDTPITPEEVLTMQRATFQAAAAEFVGMPAEMIVGKTDREIFGHSTDALLMQQVFSDVNNQGKLINQENSREANILCVPQKHDG